MALVRYFTVLNISRVSCLPSSSSFHGPSARHEGQELKWKKQGDVTQTADRENEVIKMFILFLGKCIELESSPRSQAVRTVECGSLSQPITAHVVPERCKNAQ